MIKLMFVYLVKSVGAIFSIFLLEFSLE